MIRSVDINADLGEGYTTDEAVLGVVSSANIACGFHAGDARTMREVSAAALSRKVAIGAHPSFDDLANFGRRVIRMSKDELESLVAYQIGALQEAAHEVGATLAHVKPHGALYNIASTDEGHAMAIARAIRHVDRNLIYVGFAGSVMRRAADRTGLAFAAEAFPDRHYADNGGLMDRNQPLSVITSPEKVAERVRQMMEDGSVQTLSGKTIPLSFDTLCVHGDEPTAVMVCRAVRRAVEDAGGTVAPLSVVLGQKKSEGSLSQTDERARA